MRRRRLEFMAAALLLTLPSACAWGFGPDVTAADARFRFVVLSDIHVTATDLPGSRDQLRRAVDEINGFQSQIDLVLVAGDLAQSAAPVEMALELQVAKEELDRLAVPYHVSIGNHDVTSMGDDSAFRGLFGATSYRFVHRGVHFVSLRTPVNQEATYLAAAALDSLSLRLGEIAPTEPLVVFAHHPLGPITPDGVSNKQAFYDRVDGHALVAVFSGHYHGNFEESRHGAWYSTARALSQHRTNHDGDETKGYRLASVWPDCTVSASFYALGQPPTFAPAPPYFASTGNRYALAGRELRVRFAARDDQGETIAYTAGGLPPGADFDAVQRQLVWTPGMAQVGLHAGMSFLATNSAGTDTLDLAVRVLPAACLYDDFAAGLSGWTASGGGWSAQNGELVQASAGGGAYTCTAGGSLADLYLEADVAHEDGVGYAGLVFRFLDPGNYYYVWNNGSQVEIRRRVGGVASRLGDAVPVGAIAGWHHLRIEALGADLKLYWDGRLRFEATDTTFASGQVGVVCSQAAARFDNLIATGCTGLDDRPPVLQSIGERTAFVGAACELDLQATDPDGDPLAWEGVDLPAGAVLEPATGRFRWTPPPQDAWNSLRCTFRVTDGELDDAETVVFAVLDTTRACTYEGFSDSLAAGKWLPSGGTWSVTNGAYVGTATTPSWSRIGSSARADYTLQARVRVEGDGSGNLVFRALDPTHYYYLRTVPNSNTLELRKQQGATSTALASGGDVLGSVKNRWHTYRVEALGNRIRVWADGERRFEVVEVSGAYLTGAVGLRVEAATMRADDFVVYDCAGGASDSPGPPCAPLRNLVCYPNPFNPHTAIRFELGSEAEARVAIFAADGRRVRSLFDGSLVAGAHELPWDGRDDGGRLVASGVYYLRVEAGGRREGARLVLVR